MNEKIIARLKSQATHPGKCEKPLEVNVDDAIRNRLRQTACGCMSDIMPKPVVPLVSTAQTTSIIPQPVPDISNISAQYPDASSNAKGGIIQAGNAYDDSIKLMKAKLQKDDLGLFNALSQVQPGEIMVVTGSYDSIETILSKSKIPYTELKYANGFTKNAGVIFVNCSSSYSLNKDALRSFVQYGGYLVTTDWALDLIVKSIFGNIGKKGGTPNDVVDVTPDEQSFYVKGAFPKGIKPAWWLEGGSHVIGVSSPGNVSVMIRSGELNKKYNSDVIGCTFPYGKGRVFHFISHFRLQQSKQYLAPDKQQAESFAKNVLELSDSELKGLGINKGLSYAAVETAFSSAMIVHRIIAARKMGYNGR